MELLVFLLGAAFGVSMSSLCLLVEAVLTDGLSEDVIMDIVYECVSIVFIFALFSVYMKLR